MTEKKHLIFYGHIRQRQHRGGGAGDAPSAIKSSNVQVLNQFVYSFFITQLASYL